MNPQDEALSVTRADATSFLESAVRNWSHVPRLSNDDLDDVAGALQSFLTKRRHRLSHSTPGDAEVIAAIKRSRDTAMEYAVKARIPECGKFGEIAQDLDAALSSLAAPGDAEVRKALAALLAQVDHAAMTDGWADYGEREAARALLATPSGRAQGEVGQ